MSTTINTASANAFRAAVKSATTKAEVTSALAGLEKAKDLSPSEKVSLALEAKDTLTSARVGHGIEGALTGFIESQGAPLGQKSSPMMSRIGNVLANSAKDLHALIDDVAKLASVGKGQQVSAGDLESVKGKLKLAFNQIDHTDDEVLELAQNVAKGNDKTVTAGDVNAVHEQLTGWYAQDMKPVLDAIEAGDAKGASAKLPDAIASLVRAADMAKNTKEVSEVVAEQVQVGKGGGVETPTPFLDGAGAAADFNSLKPDATVLGRTSKDSLKFAESKLEHWHNTRDVSDNDVTLVRKTLRDVFQLDPNKFLAMSKGAGESALTSGHLLSGEVKDSRTGGVVGQFNADLNTGAIQISDVVVRGKP